MEPPWLKKAKLEIGVHELSGEAHNERILQYHRETKLQATSDEVPWCASFACAMLEWSGVPSPRSARAMDFMKWGLELQKPVLGCIVVMSRGPGLGHVGFYVHESDSKITLLGGNQKDSVCEMAFPKEFILGYRLPGSEYWAPNSEGTEDNPNYS